MSVWSGVSSFFSLCRREGRYERPRERLDKRLTDMHAAIADFLRDNKPREAFWEEWRYQVKHARHQVERRKRTFYILRLTAIVSIIAVPSLAGLNGTGGIPVRWATFALSLVAAISTAVITLFRLGDR